MTTTTNKTYSINNPIPSDQLAFRSDLHFKVNCKTDAALNRALSAYGKPAGYSRRNGSMLLWFNSAPRVRRAPYHKVRKTQDLWPSGLIRQREAYTSGEAIVSC